MPRACLGFGLISGLLLTAGCGTLDNLVAPDTPRADGMVREPPKLVYGGTRLSLQQGWSNVTQPREFLEPAYGVYQLAVDSPLSVVGDTLTLPITVHASIERGVNAYYFPEGQEAREQPDQDSNPEHLVRSEG